MSNNWINYWSKKNIWSPSSIWIKNSNIFSKEVIRNFSINKNIDILDIGCGTGDFIEKLNPYVNEIYGVDISNVYIKICKKKFNIKYKNIFIKLYKDNYKNLYKMNKKFSFIFCNSVVQYFSNKNEIIELVKAVKKTSIKGSKFLISDIMDIKEKKNLFRFIFYSFLRGYFFSLIKHYFILILNPEYRKLEIKYKLLRVDTHKIIKEIKPLCKKVKIIYTPLTINVNRKHILIEF